VPHIGDDYLTPKEYKALRQKYRAAQTTVPWDRWSRRYLSPAGKRDRDAVQAQQQADTRRRKAVAAGIRGQVQEMDEESRRAGLDPVRQERVAQRLARANERDWETGGNYARINLTARTA
jgi:hypothetical protein